jgi:hypothetical protein
VGESKEKIAHFEDQPGIGEPADEKMDRIAILEWIPAYCKVTGYNPT